MKKLLPYLLLFFYTAISAQLDREHWFAPMYDGQSNPGPSQFLHLSTNETVPFNVEVYSNNLLVYQRTISKGNPAIISISRNFIITSSVTELHRIGTKGLYVKAERPCFANLRFKVSNHAEIITSKGTAGIGKKFYTVMAPNLHGSTNLGASASILATEDNTVVTVNNFKKVLTFNAYGTASSFTFTLNKGQSFILDARASNMNNREGFIGATVTADKPISMSNGNFNGQYATSDESEGSDILMDQSVPVDKLGDEFAIVKGYGAIGNNMEGAMVVATENNTAIYLNDSAVPFATLATAGDYYLISEANYINRGNDHYNLRIKTDKNVYVYQLLGGVEGGTAFLATGGMNYIPPLNCYLPKKIDEISNINKMALNDATESFLTKLNIITAKGAVVKVNGVVPNAQYGPFDTSNIPAQQAWVTYSIPGVTGNITIESDKAVTAGIASGNAAFGYGGYFAGFSAIPLILKTAGDCLPGVKLEVTAGFDSYEWLIKNPDSTYSPAPGINNTYTYEPPQAGIYAVKVKQGICDEIQTQDFKFYNCTTYTNYDFDSCGNETITPTFALSSQTVNPSTVQIVTPPTKGTVTIAADGKLTYTANPNVSGTDTFKFSFCGIGAIPDCETVQITINMIEKYDDKVLQECSTNGIATYNLSLAPVSPDNTLVKSYFKTFDGAQNDIPGDEILNFTSYTSGDGFIYIRLVNSIGCISVAKVELKSKLAPEVKENLYTKLHCDEDVDGKIDGTYKVDLTTVTPVVLVQTSNFVVKYYDTFPKATAGLNDNITGIFSFTGDTSVWIRVEAQNGCPTVIKEIQLKTGTKFTVAPPQSKLICDTNQDNTEDINLNDFVSMFTSDTSATVKFIPTLTAAQNNTPAIVAIQNITADKTFYYRFSRAGLCDVIGVLNIIFKKATPSPTLPANVPVCLGSTTTLDIGSGYTGILWSTGATTQTITAGAGTYTVEFTNADGCRYQQTVTVTDSPKPKWNIAAYSAVNCDDDFDGFVNVKFSTVTPLIVQNSTLFTVEYSLFSDFRTLLPDDWTYSADTTVYVRAYSSVCPAEKQQIDFKVGNSLALDQASATVIECDDDFDAVKSVNLANHLNEFTSDPGVVATYYSTLADAQKKINSISNQVNVSGTGVYYLRLHKNTYCDVIGKLTVNIQIPKKSEQLSDKQICPEATTVLNAGSGFDKYLWSTGATTSSITVPVGEYWVDLTSGSCVYRQNVSVTAVSLPEIVSVEIVGSTVTVNVTGGTSPYQYAIDSFNYKSSNVFTNVPGGDHTVYVISADNCKPVSVDFNVIQQFNVITPNGDGKNDLLDYSGLMKKSEPYLVIFDRRGQTVFTGTSNNQFIWDGKISGRALESGSYWYVMRWIEPGFTTVTEYKGWVLLKNRN